MIQARNDVRNGMLQGAKIRPCPDYGTSGAAEVLVANLTAGSDFFLLRCLWRIQRNLVVDGRFGRDIGDSLHFLQHRNRAVDLERGPA